MVIIFQQGNSFWIETHSFTSSVANAATQTNNIVPDRQGVLLCCQVSKSVGAVSEIANVSSQLKLQSGDALPLLPFDLQTNPIRAETRNNQGSTRTITTVIMLMMRGSGH